MTLLLPRCYRPPTDSKIGTKQKEARKPVEQPAPAGPPLSEGRCRMGKALATHQKQPDQQEQDKENYHPQQGEAARRHTILLANGWEAA